MSKDNVFSERANREQWEQLLFVLEGRRKPTIVVVSFDIYETRNRFYQKMIKDLPNYKHHKIDLSSHNVVSLKRQFKETLPEYVWNSKPAEYAVHVFGLENSILAHHMGKIEESGLISQLNYEREALFHDPPFITVIWSDNYIFEKLKTEAGDLWDWITYKFQFTGESRKLPIAAEPEKRPSIPKGRLPERKKRINNLVQKYDRLILKGAEKERIIREKINIQKLLGQEYLELNKYKDAIKSFKTALLLSKQIESSQHIKLELFYRLGDVYLEARDFDTSLESYKSSLQLQKNYNISVTMGNTFHQMGMVFEKQRKWSDALTHYQTAIDWQKKNDTLFALGSTYHQMGRVFQKQQKWNDALTHYQMAIDWKNKTDNLFALGNTYHQMGKVFEAQEKWNDAFISHLNALQYNYTIQAKRDLTIGHIKDILPKLPQTESKDLFEKHYPSEPSERKKHCQKLIW